MIHTIQMNTITPVDSENPICYNEQTFDIVMQMKLFYVGAQS